jgi:hypothetical protein
MVCSTKDLLFNEAGQCHLGSSVTLTRRLGGKDFYPAEMLGRENVAGDVLMLKPD